MPPHKDGSPNLKQVLYTWQTLSIAITVVIGSGVFTDYGSVAKTCGPAGLLIVFLIVGFVAVCSMDSFSELLQLFPTVNPMVELVHEFVDPDLARVVGFSYWFAYSSFLSVQVATAASYLNLYAAPSGGWLFGKVVTFWVLVPLVITLLNIAPVRYFGYVESAGGLLKLVLLSIVVLMLFYIAGEAHGGRFIEEGVTGRLTVDALPGSAICLSITFILFSFLGIEAIAVTAFEAFDVEDIRQPSQWVTPIIFLVYFLCTLAQIMVIDWKVDKNVPSLADSSPLAYTLSDGRSTASALIIGALEQNEQNLANAINAIMLFCALSAANSTVYVSSRMLFGLAYMNVKESSSRGWKWLAHVNEYGVPLYAVLVSSCAFVWLPFTQLAHDEAAAARLISWFNNAGSLCILFCWGAVNLAYIRYYRWFRSFRAVLRDDYPRLDRTSDQKGFHTFLWRFQPWVAWFALLSSVVIIFAFSSAALWKPGNTVSEFFEYYTMPMLLPLCWVLLKAYRIMNAMHHGKTFERAYRELQLYVKLSNKRRQFETTISNLTEFLKPSQRAQVTSLLVHHEEREIEHEPEVDEGIAMSDLRRRTTADAIDR